jgi:GH24 family phage-related lysozyme (muramidase)
MDVRESAVTRTAGFEAFVEHFYLDTAGKVTIGYGRMVPNADAAADLPLKKNGSDAEEDAKRDEWTLIKSKPAGKPASYYKQFTKLTLPESDAKAMLRENLEGFAADLKTRFPDLDDYPNDAQDALLDMMFNLGLTKFSKANWPKLFAAVEAKDWTKAAAESNRPDVQDERNEAIHDLFVSAAGVSLKLYLEARIVAESFKDQIGQLSSFISTGQGVEKFFPHGITKIKLDVKAGGVGIDFEISGPEQGKPSVLARKRKS